MRPFFDLQTLEQVHQHAAAVRPLAAEAVSLAQAVGRTLAAELRAAADLPGFARAAMDGYAVAARDTFGAAESAPAFLDVAGEVRMGERSTIAIRTGQCAQIATGGMLPEAADAVVMVEHTRRAELQLVEVTRPVAPGDHVIGPTDDASAGELLLAAGCRLRPQDVGLLAALGVARPLVVRQPRVGIISSGDEVVPIEQTPPPGSVRDVNRHLLAAQVAQAGGVARPLGLVGDDAAQLRAAVERSLRDCELTLLSGGSSVGSRDLTVEVFDSFDGACRLVHGVSVAPGKPFIWTRVGQRHLLGLPGQVTSCWLAFHLFVEPILERLLGRPARPFCRFGRQPARLTHAVAAAAGRETYVRVRLVEQSGDAAAAGHRWLARPLFGKSGVLRNVTRAHGLVRVPLGLEGLDAGAEVTVLVIPEAATDDRAIGEEEAR